MTSVLATGVGSRQQREMTELDKSRTYSQVMI